VTTPKMKSSSMRNALSEHGLAGERFK